MIIRKTTIEDMASVLEIIHQAQEYLKQQTINQWQNGYPNKESIIEDIQKGHSYVVEIEGQVVATMAILFGMEPTYECIYEGEWKTKGNSYITIHRVAVHNDWKGQGVAKHIIEKAIELCQTYGIESIRIDTHRENLSMQSMIKKNGFDYCGIIYLEDGAERLAYERRIRR